MSGSEIRNRLYLATYGSGLSPVERTKLIDDLLHEEAEKVREKQKSEAPLFPEEDPFMNGYGSGLDDAADLIDPYVKGE